MQSFSIYWDYRHYEIFINVTDRLFIDLIWFLNTELSTWKCTIMPIALSSLALYFVEASNFFSIHRYSDKRTFVQVFNYWILELFSFHVFLSQVYTGTLHQTFLCYLQVCRSLENFAVPVCTIKLEQLCKTFVSRLGVWQVSKLKFASVD